MSRCSSAAATAPATSSTDAMAPIPMSPHASRLLTGGITVTVDAAAVDDDAAAVLAVVLQHTTEDCCSAAANLTDAAEAAAAATAALVLALLQAAGNGPIAAAAAAEATAAVGEELPTTATEPPNTEEPNAPASAFTAQEGCPSEVSRSSCRAVRGLSHIKVFMAGAT